MRLLFSKLLLVVALVTTACQQHDHRSIPYPEPLPEDSILTFLPGIVSTAGDSIDFNAAFSPDGKSFYFARSEKGKWNLYVSLYEGEKWGKAKHVSFHDDRYSQADPAFDPSGNLYFISNRPLDSRDTLNDFDIWLVRPSGNGEWSEPENLTIVNSDSTEYYVSFTRDGSMYFASSRSGGFGQEDIYVSQFVNGKYEAPVNLGPSINSSQSDHDPCLSQDESYIIYTSVDRKEGLGEGDLYYSGKGADGNWKTGLNMGNYFNTPTYEYCSYFSPDYKYFFFSSRRDVKWTSTRHLEAIVDSID